MAKPILEENEEATNYRKPRTLDREQLEYSAKQLFTYGTIVISVAAIYITFTYLLVQKIKN